MCVCVCVVSKRITNAANNSKLHHIIANLAIDVIPNIVCFGVFFCLHKFVFYNI